MMNFDFISADKLLLDSFALGKKIYESGFIPTHAVSLWRGGTPVGLGVGEYFRLKGHFINHTTFSTASYTGVNDQEEVIIKGLEHLIKTIAHEDKLLIIDDIYDSGKTIDAVIKAIQSSARANAPKSIRIACLYNKKRPRDIELPVISIEDKPNIWISFPHEIAELVSEKDLELATIKAKSQEIFEIISEPKICAPEKLYINDSFAYVRSNQLLLDALQLAVNIFESGFRPDFIIAVWPGGIQAALLIHEYFKFRILRDCLDIKVPDHISINTSGSHLSYKNTVIGIQYLEDTINKDDTILLVDTCFGTGRLITDTINVLKESLRRNLTIENIKTASLFINPKPAHDITWATMPWFDKPHFHLYETEAFVIFPYQIHRLPQPEQSLKTIWPELHQVLYDRDYS